MRILIFDSIYPPLYKFVDEEAMMSPVINIQVDIGELELESVLLLKDRYCIIKLCYYSNSCLHPPMYNLWSNMYILALFVELGSLNSLCTP